MSEKREQVARQYEVVAHLAQALATVHKEMAAVIRNEGHDFLLDMRGNRSAHIMEVLGNILNGMDAVDSKKDEWVNPIFRKAHEMFPQSGETP